MKSYLLFLPVFLLNCALSLVNKSYCLPSTHHLLIMELFSSRSLKHAMYSHTLKMLLGYALMDTDRLNSASCRSSSCMRVFLRTSQTSDKLVPSVVFNGIAITYLPVFSAI